MKTIIGSLLTVLLIIGMTLGISVSIVPMQVQAETEVTIEETSDGIYFDNYAVLGREIFNETYSGETEPIGWKKGPLSALDQYYSRKVEGDAMVIRHLDTETSSSSLDTFASKDIMDFVLDNDTEKMTRLLSNQVSGKFAVEMEFEADLNTDRANPTYIQFEFGYRESPDLGAADMSSPLAQIRLFTNGNLRYQHSSTIVSTTTFVKEQRHTLRLEIDTETAKINVFLDDDHFAVNEDIIANHVKLFNAIKIRTMRATAMGSYFKLYGIRVYQLDDSASEVFTGAFDTYGALPDIASDPSNVVSDLQIPDVAEYGVTSVTSSDTVSLPQAVRLHDIDDQSASIYMQYFKTYSNSTPKAEYQIVFRKAYDFTVKQ